VSASSGPIKAYGRVRGNGNAYSTTGATVTKLGGAGAYRINLANNIPGGNYVVQLTAYGDGRFISVTSQSANNFTIQVSHYQYTTHWLLGTIVNISASDSDFYFTVIN